MDEVSELTRQIRELALVIRTQDAELARLGKLTDYLIAKLSELKVEVSGVQFQGAVINE
jgi:hypothetical protein